MQFSKEYFKLAFEPNCIGFVSNKLEMLLYSCCSHCPLSLYCGTLWKFLAKLANLNELYYIIRNYNEKTVVLLWFQLIFDTFNEIFVVKFLNI